MVMVTLLNVSYALIHWSSITTVDSSGDVGKHCFLALDSLGNPHISYSDNTNMDLIYARWTGSEWSVETVDSTGIVGGHSSLALDSLGNPHISYQDETNYDLKYARWTGSAWNIYTVDLNVFVGFYSSLALDSNDHPHISFYDQTNGDLKYTQGIWLPPDDSIIILYNEDSYDFSTNTRGHLSGGDFYFGDHTVSGKFWANNLGQRGLQDLGDIGFLPLSEVSIPSSGYYRFGVLAVVNHTYVSLAQEGEEGKHIIFRVLSLDTDNYSVTIDYYYSEGTSPTPTSIPTPTPTSTPIQTPPLTPSPTPTTKPTPTQSPTQDSTLPDGRIIGIILGIIVGLAITILLIIRKK
jgi:hypothetical protein